MKHVAVNQAYPGKPPWVVNINAESIAAIESVGQEPDLSWNIVIRMHGGATHVARGYPENERDRCEQDRDRLMGLWAGEQAEQPMLIGVTT